MKKTILTIFLILMTMTVLTACSGNINGTWKLYGAVECGTDFVDNFQKSDIITGDEFKAKYGQDVPDKTLTISDDGIKELNGAGTNFEKVNDNQYKFTYLAVDYLDGKPQHTPIQLETYYTLSHGYLFEKSPNNGDIMVYEK